MEARFDAPLIREHDSCLPHPDRYEPLAPVNSAIRSLIRPRQSHCSWGVGTGLRAIALQGISVSELELRPKNPPDLCGGGVGRSWSKRNVAGVS